MKTKILSIALATLTIGLLGSCSKINERIDSLEERIDGIGNGSIASIEQQIAGINASIANLESIRTNVQTLMDDKKALEEDITALETADLALEGHITELNTYVSTELAKYVTKDWANATFATLEEQAEIMADINKIKTDLAGLDENLDKAISDLEGGMKTWVNEQLSAYCTTARMEAEIADLQSEIDALKDSKADKAKIEELETSLDKLSADLSQAKADIKSAYEKAIKDAIEGNDGYITETIKNAIDDANTKITALTGRVETLESTVAALSGDVDALKAMIQTVSVIPAYNDGSLKAEGGILTINCVITPKDAVDGLTKDNFTVLTSEVLTRSGLYGTIAIANDEDLVLDTDNGTATIRVDVSAVLPAEADKALTVALNVKNGISDYTTDFVPVYAAAAPGPVLPEGALTGRFSVSASKQVQFSKGNLVATIDAAGTPTAWKFAANQYDCLGEGGANKTIGTAAGDVDLFGWSTTATKYGISTSTSSSDYSGDFVDWGKKIGDGSTWRTLSKDEWTYLFNTTSRMVNSKPCYSNAVSGVSIGGTTYKGVFIYPDNYNGNEVSSSMTWDQINAAGIVFLPAAGYRDGSNVGYVGDFGYYWSSTALGSDSAFSVGFNSIEVSPGNDDHRDFGFNVRLITECQ